MAGVEAEKIVPNTEEKTTTTETPKETVQTDDSVTAVEVEIKGEEAPKVEKETEKPETAPPVKEEKPVEEEKDGKPKDEAPKVEEKAVDGKAE